MHIFLCILQKYNKIDEGDSDFCCVEQILVSFSFTLVHFRSSQKNNFNLGENTMEADQISSVLQWIYLVYLTATSSHHFIDIYAVFHCLSCVSNKKMQQILKRQGMLM